MQLFNNRPITYISHCRDNADTANYGCDADADADTCEELVDSVSR